MKLTSLKNKSIELGYLKETAYRPKGNPDKGGKLKTNELMPGVFPIENEFKGKPFMQNTPNEFAYLDFKKWAYPRRGKIKQRLQAILDNNQADPGVPFFKELTKIWVMWANNNDEAFSVVNPTDVGQKDFGRALAVMMKNDNLIINKESSKLLNLKEMFPVIALQDDDRSEKDKEFDLSQQLSKLTKDDRIKLKKIIQLMAKEKNEEKIAGFDYQYTHGTSGGTQQFGRPRIANELDIPAPKGYTGTMPSDITPEPVSIEKPSINTSGISVFDEDIPSVSAPDVMAPELEPPSVSFGSAPSGGTPSIKLEKYIKEFIKKLRNEKYN
jgi:hypothetical protein